MMDKPLIKLNPEEAEELLQQYDGQIQALKKWQKDALPYLKHKDECRILEYEIYDDANLCDCGLQSLISQGEK